jgi:hypothetical protein
LVVAGFALQNGYCPVRGVNSLVCSNLPGISESGGEKPLWPAFRWLSLHKFRNAIFARVFPGE